MREGNRKDVPSEMQNGFVRLFVCLFVCLWCRVASVYKIVACSGGYIYVRGFIRFLLFLAIFRPRGGKIQRRGEA